MTNSAGYARRFPRVESFGRGFNSRHLHLCDCPAIELLDNRVINCNMKKLFLIGLLSLTVACQSATLTSSNESTPTTAPHTASAPVTVTITFTSSPASTPTPVPLYFTEEFNTDMSAWGSFQTGGEAGPTLTLENDLLRLDISSPNTWYYAIQNIHDYDDVFISARFGGTPSGSMGLLCRYNDSGWYEFNLASDGTYSVLFAQRLADGIAQYTPITSDSSEYLQPGNLSYEIGLTCQENFLLLHINGKLFRKLDVTKYGLTRGKIGFTASSFDQTPMTATFDWVKVSEPNQ